MTGKHYIIATQTGYLDGEFHSKEAAVKALAEEVKAAVKECRQSYKTCSVVGSARSGSVQIKVGGRQGYHLWQRYVINERPGSRKTSKPLQELRAASKPLHATRKKSSAQLEREIAEALGKSRSRAHARKFSPGDPNADDYLRFLDDINDPPRTELYRAAKSDRDRDINERIYTLSAEQLAALRTFAKANGRSWKSKLNTAWSTGRYDDYNGTDDYGSLQEIRNMFGPSWLVKFSFVRPTTHSVKH